MLSVLCLFNSVRIAVKLYAARMGKLVLPFRRQHFVIRICFVGSFHSGKKIQPDFRCIGVLNRGPGAQKILKCAFAQGKKIFLAHPAVCKSFHHLVGKGTEVCGRDNLVGIVLLLVRNLCNIPIVEMPRAAKEKLKGRGRPPSVN